MSDARRQVEEALRAVVVHSAAGYSWFGRRSARLPPASRRLLTREAARRRLSLHLQHQLYRDFYCRGFAAPAQRDDPGPHPGAGRMPFVEELSAANRGSGYLEGGWEVRAVDGGELVAHRGDLALWVRLEDCLAPRGKAIAPGMRLRLRFPKELFGISPGFYMARGNAGLPDEQAEELVRTYWNLTPAGATRFMERATAALNRERVPFNLKVLNDPRAFSRCDAVVLYLRKQDYPAVRETLETVCQAVAAHLRQGTPAFTKRLAPGVGLAEDPAQDLSFGEHRCLLLAEGILRAHEQGKRLLPERLQAVAEHFAEAGVDLERPFLNSGSSDEYRFRPRAEPRPARPPVTGPPRRCGFGMEACRRVSEAIGDRLSREAIWHEGRCNWMGARPVEAGSIGCHGPSVRYGPLGPDLYDGTAGVALFLGELHRASGDTAARRTALGAILHALSRVAAVPATDRFGLYSGVIGIALVAARLGTVLGEDHLLEQAAALVHDLGAGERRSQELDLLSGRAGAIPALLVLRDLLQDRAALDLASRLADDLLAEAGRSNGSWSWGSPAFPAQRHLTGFSHGAAGVGYALLEVFHATGESRFRSGALGAFAYERRCFDARSGNWPDYREEPMAGRSRRASPSFATFWCHGAPGIALSRLRAFSLLHEETCKAEALIALRTTREAVRRVYANGEDFSLCHGLAGNASVLWYGCDVLGQDVAADRELVFAVARAGIDLHAMHGGPWPCGTGSGETPGLMLGLAGIGYFYLRLHEPKTPSIIILQREELSSRS